MVWLASMEKTFPVLTPPLGQIRLFTFPHFTLPNFKANQVIKKMF